MAPSAEVNLYVELKRKQNNCYLMEAFIAVYREPSCFNLLLTGQMCTPSAEGFVLPSHVSETILFHRCREDSTMATTDRSHRATAADRPFTFVFVGRARCWLMRH